MQRDCAGNWQHDATTHKQIIEGVDCARLREIKINANTDVAGKTQLQLVRKGAKEECQ
jgi:hypothetical protein